MVRDVTEIVSEFTRTLEEAVITLRKCYFVRDVCEVARCHRRAKRLQRKVNSLFLEYQALKNEDMVRSRGRLYGGGFD